MICRNRGISWILSIGDVRVRICSDQTAANIVQTLKNLFPGFVLPDSPGVDTQLIVSYDFLTGYNQMFDPEPIDMAKKDHPLMAKLLQKANTLHGPFTYRGQNTFIVGFLNGCLFYEQDTGKALCLLFHMRNGKSFIVGSLHKLLFVFLCLVMAEKGQFLIHGAAIRNGPEGYIFWGSSGAGKSTIASFSARDNVLSDDAPLLRKMNDQYCCSATPFCQMDRGGQNDKSAHSVVAITRHLFLHQSKELKVKDRSQSEAVAEIISKHLHCFDFMNRSLRGKAFHFLYDFCLLVPAYDLYFTKDNRFWGLIAGNG